MIRRGLFSLAFAKPPDKPSVSKSCAYFRTAGSVNF
jgi:hypothetical protein